MSSTASRLPLVGWLFPSPDEPGRAIARRTQILLIVLLTIANAIGAAVVFVFLGLVLPSPEADSEGAVILNLAVTAGYLLLGAVVGAVWGSRRMVPVNAWLRSERPATEEERQYVLRAPYRIVRVHAILWGLAAVLFGVLNWTYAPELGAAGRDDGRPRRPHDVRDRLPPERADASARSRPGACGGRRDRRRTRLA